MVYIFTLYHIMFTLHYCWGEIRNHAISKIKDKILRVWQRPTRCFLWSSQEWLGCQKFVLIPALFINSAIGIERFLNCFLVVMNLSKICILRPGYICPDLALKTFNTRLVLAHCFWLTSAGFCSSWNISSFCFQTAQPDPIEIQRQQEIRRRAIAKKRAREQLRARSPDAVEGRKHIEVQTELYLEELSDRYKILVFFLCVFSRVVQALLIVLRGCGCLHKLVGLWCFAPATSGMLRKW